MTSKNISVWYRPTGSAPCKTIQLPTRGLCGEQWLSRRMPDSQSREPEVDRIPFAIVSKFGEFRSLHGTPVHSAV